MTSPKVLIVGAGLAGLSCAIELESHGLDPTLIEAGARVGGRVQTDVVDGFRLDHGFQVLLTAYPETQRLLDYSALELRPFLPGALIRRRGDFVVLADPWRRPAAGLLSLLRGTVSFSDGLRMARLTARVRRASQPAGDATVEKTAIERLRTEGFSNLLIETFFRPFLGGVFLERELETSERQLEFVFRMFGAGDIAVPAHGMGEIPKQLAARLARTDIRTGTAVEKIAKGGVIFDGGKRVTADAVVVATDASTAAELVGDVYPLNWRGVTCCYFAASAAPINGPQLILNGEGDGPVNNLCVMSEVAGEYAPLGQALISATVLGTPDSNDVEARVLQQLEGWFGSEVRTWRHLKTYRIDRALPDQSPPRPPLRSPKLREGIYLCGDHWHDASINGALASGRRAARALVSDIEDTRR